MKKKDSKWFNQVIESKLNGQSECRIERLTEKQVIAFSRFMVPDKSSYKGNRYIYESVDGRFTATMTVLKYRTSLSIYDNVQIKILDIETRIAMLQRDINSDVADGIPDFLEEDTKHLLFLNEELNSLKQVIA
ncbi:hypothetical protein ACI2LM_13320 [Paenibacillus lautus]|uniref:hypothetical protein n=1 Tax=Paenibacillus lautus TaxID=1401 RepID=UPI0038507329